MVTFVIIEAFNDDQSKFNLNRASTIRFDLTRSFTLASGWSVERSVHGKLRPL